MIIIDAHEDLAWNMLTFERDYTRSAAETRHLEGSGLAPDVNGDTLLGWLDYQRGRVAIVFATLFCAPERLGLGDWDTQVYRTPLQAHQRYSTLLDAYHRLVDSHSDQFRLIRNKTDLDTTLAQWEEVTQEKHPVGLVVLMEGAEGVQEPAELEDWWERGVRLIGPAWAGTRFCGGTREPGPLTQDGFALLEGMADLGFTLDLSHMDEQAVLQALDVFPGAIVATHANALALLKGTESNRHLSDRVLRGLINRDGIIGLVPFNRFLVAGWSPEDGRETVSLDRLVTQIDYICQLAGDARHAGIGSD
jgi:membrane dipeptidase